jgi:ribosomal protein L31
LSCETADDGIEKLKKCASGHKAASGISFQLRPIQAHPFYSSKKRTLRDEKRSSLFMITFDKYAKDFFN